MFSDDNRVMWFIKYLVPYDEISSYSIVENVVQKAQTQTKSRGVISRAIIGGAIAGGVGAVVGAASAGSKSQTTYYNEGEGFSCKSSRRTANDIAVTLKATGLLRIRFTRNGLSLERSYNPLLTGRYKPDY